MSEAYPRRGKTTIAPDVLNTIARLSTLSVPGVARMSAGPVAMGRLFQRGQTDGVRVEIRDHAVAVELYVVIQHDASVKDVSREVQNAVARAIEEMVGMDVLEVNVHIDDVAYPESKAA
jgi:uncharacterized alkaline shock family protein YloU